MNKNENITLINGEFTPEEAKEILLSMLNNKINFHRMKNFSAEERFGAADPSSTKRLSELEASRENVRSFLENAEASGNHVVMKSVVHLSLGNKIIKVEEPRDVPPAQQNIEQELIQLW